MMSHFFIEFLLVCQGHLLMYNLQAAKERDTVERRGKVGPGRGPTQGAFLLATAVVLAENESYVNRNDRNHFSLY